MSIVTKDEFVIGRKPVEEAIDAGKTIEKLWIDQSLRGEFEIKIRKACKSRSIPMIVSPPKKLNELAKNTNHQGVVAQISAIQYHKIEDILPFLYEKGLVPRILVLDGIEDVRNLGAIARSAAWFGFQVLIVPMKSSARINAFSIKTSVGALLDLYVCREKSLVNSVEYMQNFGVKVYASDMTGTNVSTIDKGYPIALILGSEENGVSSKLKSIANGILTIPGHSTKVESLNVSVAAAILMYESTSAI